MCVLCVYVCSRIHIQIHFSEYTIILLYTSMFNIYSICAINVGH